MGLRVATEYDLPKVVDIYNAAIPSRLSTADTCPVTVQDKQGWYDSHSKSRPLYVYEKGGNIEGWASFQSFYGRPAYHQTAELSIYIAQNHLNRGLGSTILKACIEQSPCLGIKNIVGYVFSHNTGSIKLLTKFGFERWGELPEIAEMDGQLYSLSILGLKLNKAAINQEVDDQ